MWQLVWWWAKSKTAAQKGFVRGFSFLESFACDTDGVWCCVWLVSLWWCEAGRAGDLPRYCGRSTPALPARFAVSPTSLPRVLTVLQHYMYMDVSDRTRLLTSYSCLRTEALCSVVHLQELRTKGCVKPAWSLITTSQPLWYNISHLYRVYHKYSVQSLAFTDGSIKQKIGKRKCRSDGGKHKKCNQSFECVYSGGGCNQGSIGVDGAQRDE